MSRVTTVERAMKAGNAEKRKWLGPVFLDSYGGESNRVEFYALEGSPPRGFIVAVSGFAVRLDSQGKRLRTYFQEYSR